MVCTESAASQNVVSVAGSARARERASLLLECSDLSLAALSCRRSSIGLRLLFAASRVRAASGRTRSRCAEEEVRARERAGWGRRASVLLSFSLSLLASSSMRVKERARKSYGGKSPRKSEPALTEPAPVPSPSTAVVPDQRSAPARSVAPWPEPAPMQYRHDLGLEHIFGPAIKRLLSERDEPAPGAASSSTSTADRPAKRFKPARSAAPEPQIKPDPVPVVDEIAACIQAVKEAREAVKEARKVAEAAREAAEKAHEATEKACEAAEKACEAAEEAREAGQAAKAAAAGSAGDEAQVKQE